MSHGNSGNKRRLIKESPFQRLAQRTIDTGEQALKEAREIEIKRIVNNPEQPRRHYNAVNLKQLADDIKQRGILQPLIVRPWTGKEGEDYQIVVGERRYRAAKMAGLEKVPAIVRELADEDVQIISLVENIQREDLDIGDEAAYFKTLQEQFSQSIREIAALVNKSKSYVEVRLKLAENPALLESVRTGKIGVHSASLAARLGAVPEDESVREKDTFESQLQPIPEKEISLSLRYPLARPYRQLIDLIKNTGRKIEKASQEEKRAVASALDELDLEITQLRRRLKK